MAGNIKEELDQSESKEEIVSIQGEMFSFSTVYKQEPDDRMELTEIKGKYRF